MVGILKENHETHETHETGHEIRIISFRSVLIRPIRPIRVQKNLRARTPTERHLFLFGKIKNNKVLPLNSTATIFGTQYEFLFL